MLNKIVSFAEQITQSCIFVQHTPKTKANKGWDLDLKYGERGQDQIQNVLVNSKIEVKHEVDWWDKTLNLMPICESASLL